MPHLKSATSCAAEGPCREWAQHGGTRLAFLTDRHMLPPPPPNSTGSTTVHMAANTLKLWKATLNACKQHPAACRHCHFKPMQLAQWSCQHLLTFVSFRNLTRSWPSHFLTCSTPAQLSCSHTNTPWHGPLHLWSRDNHLEPPRRRLLWHSCWHLSPTSLAQLSTSVAGATTTALFTTGTPSGPCRSSVHSSVSTWRVFLHAPTAAQTCQHTVHACKMPRPPDPCSGLSVADAC